MINDEKKAWAEELLRKKAKELGRLPTKKDFDHVTCSRIKAFLGTWPQALAAAGLKKTRMKEQEDMKNEDKENIRSYAVPSNKKKKGK